MIVTLWKFLFARTEQRMLEILRVCLGSVSLLWLIANLPNWNRDYGLDGMMLAYQQSQGPSWAWTVLQNLPGHEWTLLAIGALLHIGFLIGKKSPAFSFGLWSWHHLLLSINFMASNSEQFMFRWLFLYGIFLPWGKDWSLKPVYSWTLRLIQLHVVMIYLISTYWKLQNDPAWLNGSAIYYVLAGPLWSRVAGQNWITWPLVSEYLTYASLILEGAFCFVVWSKKLRPLWVGALMAFHLTLAILMQHIGFFSFSMIVALIAWVRWSDFSYKST